MIGVGTCARVARPRVNGAISMRFGAWIAPSWIGSNRLGIEAVSLTTVTAAK